MDAILQTTFSNAYSWIKIIIFWLKIHCLFYPSGAIDKKTTLFFIMTLPSGNKPLHETKMTNENDTSTVGLSQSLKLVTKPWLVYIGPEHLKFTPEAGAVPIEKLKIAFFFKNSNNSLALDDIIQNCWWHDDVIKWKHFPRYWPFVRGIQRSPVNSPHKGQWRGALMLSLICAWINGWVNNR